MKYFLFFAFFLIVQGVSSQEKSPVRFGIKAGVNLSHINFSKGSTPPNPPIPTNWQPGMVAGFVVIVPLTNNFYFQPEYLISRMGGKFENENRQFVIDYASLPVILKWEFLNKFSLLVGPQFDLLIRAKDKSGNIESSFDEDIEHRSVSITGGLEYNFSNNLVLGIKYMHGLNHIDIERGNGNQEFKYEGFQFSFSYLF